MRDSSAVQAPVVSGPPPSRQFEDATYAKVTRRLVPFLILCYVVAYLDRINVGYAKLQMLRDLRFSETVFGLGAGIFFIGYFLFEVPSNIMMHKLGARLWIARIMLSWGIVSACTLLVRTPAAFYGVRFLLGLAEAGFFPGIILYLTYWYPARQDGRDVYGCHTVVRHPRRPPLRIHHAIFCGRARLARLEMAIPPRSCT